MDSDGVAFNGAGMWRHLLNKNISTSFADLLLRCEKNESIFNILNIKTMDNAPMLKIENLLEQLTFDRKVKILDAIFEKQMQELCSTLNTNLTNKRIALRKPITEKDLNAFLDQLQVLPRKLSDLHTIKRVENLGYKVKKVIENKIKILTALKNDMAFNITKLEVLILPLHRELNRTILHLTTIQHFLNNETGKIAAEVYLRFSFKRKLFTVCVIGYKGICTKIKTPFT